MQTNKYTDRQEGQGTDKKTDIQRQTGGRIGRQTHKHRQTERQADR